MPAKKRRAPRGDDDFVSIKLPVKFVDWLRSEAEKQGKFMYRVVLDQFAGRSRGRPWDKTKQP